MIEYSVSEIVYRLKDLVENDINLKGCQVKGEVTNFNGRYPSGHLYFSLKDEDSSISCVMFASYASKIDFDLANGDKVIIKATPSLYNKTGKLQLNVVSMKKDGTGDLLQKYEELKNRLSKEGYFDDNHKKIFDIEYPSNVAVIVGDNSAAMSDIKRTFARRWPICNVDFYPSIVQGEKAAVDLINNLKKADKNNYDAIIIARGGGSFEDLFCFNDENLVKTIYDLNTFIISGVGHEQDFTLCDFVADIRASTPTASVELITPDIDEVYDKLNIIHENIINTMQDKLNTHSQTIHDSILQLNNFHKKLENLLNIIVMNRKQISTNLNNKLQSYTKDILNLKEYLKNIINNTISNLKNNLDNKSKLINAYSQENTLKRGYSIVTKNDKIIKTSKELKIDDIVDIRLYKSNVKAKIKEA